VKATEVSSILKLLEGKEVYVSNYTLLELAYLLEFVYGLSREMVNVDGTVG
jgi:predicted nucleic-acid-binding protein